MGVGHLNFLVRVMLVIMTLGFARISFADFADGLEAFDGGDLTLAIEQWQEAAANGDLDAAISLADLYISGIGIKPDPQEAVRLYRLAAERGDAVAQFNLGDLYAPGHGIEKDLAKAYVWLQRAADQGRHWAARRLKEVDESMTGQERAQALAMLSN